MRRRTMTFELRTTLWLAVVAVLAACAAAALGPVVSACAESRGAHDGRDGLSILTCPSEVEGIAVLIVTDPSVSWPVVRRDGQEASLEQAMLDGASGAEGLWFFEPSMDSVWFSGEDAVASFTTSDPVSLAPGRTYVAIDTRPPRIVGAAPSLDAALDLLKR